MPRARACHGLSKAPNAQRGKKGCSFPASFARSPRSHNAAVFPSPALALPVRIPFLFPRRPALFVLHLMLTHGLVKDTVCATPCPLTTCSVSTKYYLLPI